MAILHWPEAAAAVAYLRSRGQPRLLLVAADAEAPATIGPDEDWIRLPARDDDIRVRAETLVQRTAGRRPPELGRDGRLFFNERWTALSPSEERIVRRLLASFGEVVSPDDLVASGDGDVLSDGALRVHVTRLRRRLRPLGLAVRSLRNRGYVLDRTQ